MITDITEKLKNVYPPQAATEELFRILDQVSDVCIIYKCHDGTMGQITSFMTHTQALGFCEIGKQITIEEMKEEVE